MVDSGSKSVSNNGKHVTLVMQRTGSLKLKVLAADNKALTDLQIELRQDADKPGPYRSETFNEAGELELKNVFPGEYQLIVESLKRKMATYTQKVTIESDHETELVIQERDNTWDKRN